MTMTETHDLEGLSDLVKDRAEWCQTDNDGQQIRTGRTPSPYHNWAAPSRSEEPPDKLTVHDGTGDKMAAMKAEEHGRVTPTATRRSLNQAYFATLVSEVGLLTPSKTVNPMTSRSDDVLVDRSDIEARLAAGLLQGRCLG